MIAPDPASQYTNDETSGHCFLGCLYSDLLDTVSYKIKGLDDSPFTSLTIPQVTEQPCSRYSRLHYNIKNGKC